MSFDPNNEVSEGGQDSFSPAAFDGFHHDLCRSIGGQHHPRGWVASMTAGRSAVSTDTSDFGGHETRCQVGDRDPLGVQFVPQRIRQGFHGMLAHGIHPGGGHRDEGIDRAHDGQTTFGGNEVVGCGSYGSNDPHDIHFELSANFVFRKLIHPSLGGISSIGHHHVNAAEGLSGRSRQGFHIVGLHHITRLHKASDSAGMFDFLGKLGEPIDPSCPENEVVVPLCEHTSQSFPYAGRGAGDQGNGAV